MLDRGARGRGRRKGRGLKGLVRGRREGSIRVRGGSRRGGAGIGGD